MKNYKYSPGITGCGAISRAKTNASEEGRPDARVSGLKLKGDPGSSTAGHFSGGS